VVTSLPINGILSTSKKMHRAIIFTPLKKSFGAFSVNPTSATPALISAEKLRFSAVLFYRVNMFGLGLYYFDSQYYHGD